METLMKYGPVAGRVLLALIFLMAGVNKIFSWDGTAQYMASAGMPLVPLFLVGAIVLEVGGSLSVILGYRARWGALALIVFTIPTTLIFHNFWALEGAQQELQMIMFMKNLSMIGGLLLVTVYGAGTVGLDARSAAIVGAAEARQ